MLGINEMNQELVRAFNINLCYNDIAITNLTMQNLHGKDHIVISFDKNMKHGQCMKYLSALEDKIIKRSYKDKKAANVSYNLQSFPFNFKKGRLEKDNKGKRFSVEIDEGVVFNLKCYLAQALAGDVKEKMGREFGVQYAKEHVYDISFDRSSYLYCMLFRDGELQKDFVDLFSAKIRRYENAPSDYLEENGNLVYIKKSIFDDIEFIKDIEAHNASLICRDFQTPSSKNKVVENLKFPIISFIRKTGIPVHSVIRTSYEGSNEDSVLIPIVAKNGKGNRLFDDNDAYKINSAFNMEILSDVSESISVRLPKSDSSDSITYGIDFADVDISYCVLNKIMESSVINKDHELSIDPERALSPAQSPFNSPTHAGPSGLRTPPNQRKADRDSGIGESPPKPKDSVAHSSSDDPGSFLEQSQAQRFPAWNQDVAKDSPRQGSEKKQVLHNPVNLAGTSKGFPPRSHLSYTAVSRVVSGPSSLLQSVGAVQNVQAGTSDWSKPMNRWSSPAPSAEPSLWQPSRPSSWKGANPRAQPMSPGSSQSSDVITPSIRYGIPRRPILLTTKNDPKSSSPEFSVRSPGVEDVKSICNEEHKEQKVIDKSDQKSSDECSEAKSQDSKSPKKHGGGWRCSERKPDGRTFREKISSPFRRNNKRRDSVCSSVSAPGGSVTEKPPLSERSASERKAKSNPSSKVTSPVHSTINSSIPGLSSQGAVDKNVSGDRNSQASAASADSGLGKSLERKQSPSLIKGFSGSSQRKQGILKRFLNKFLSDNSKTTKDILFDEGTFSCFSPEMQKVLSLPLSCDMVSNLCQVLPPEEHKELILLARSEKVKKSQSLKEIEQLFSSLSREGQEICSLLFFPEKQNEMCGSLSPTAKEQVDLFWTTLIERGISDKDSGVSLGPSSQESTSDDEDELEASGGFSQSGRSSVSSNSSTSTVRTKVDSPKTEKHSQKEREVFV